MEINQKLKKYIETEILPSYQRNDEGHNIEHINYVIKKSLNFAKTIPNINIDMVYTIAAYHDIGHYIDAKNHEKVSAEMVLKDKKLNEFFNDKQIKEIAEAVMDHRASSENDPRSVYGEIIASADKNTSIDVSLKRTFNYTKRHNPTMSTEEIMEKSRQHMIDKFGEHGYAREKIYYGKEEYENYINKITALAENKEEFKKRYKKVNKLN